MVVLSFTSVENYTFRKCWQDEVLLLANTSTDADVCLLDREANKNAAVATLFILQFSSFVVFCLVDIAVEKAPVEAASFDHSNLNKVETEEKGSLPSVQGEEAKAF